MSDAKDGCVQRGPGRAKTAAGLTVFLLEELGDARLRCAQLKGYVSEAVKLIEKSPQRDHLFETAAHLIHGIPDALFRLEKALDAAAMSAARMDYEEIKNDLKPEKAEELEKAFEDIRLRTLRKRRMGSGIEVGATVDELNRIADDAEATGLLRADDVLTLVATLERGQKAASTASPVETLRKLASSLRTATGPSRLKLAADLRKLLAESLEPTPDLRTLVGAGGTAE